MEFGDEEAWHTAGASVCRMQHLRTKKVKQRKRTRDLYYALDPLVPVREDLSQVEKGCLPSRRTFLQLQNDARAHLHELKVQRDAAAHRQPQSSKHDNAAAGGRGHEGGKAGGGAAALHCGMIREGMLSSSQLLLLEVNTTSWAVLRISQGLRLLFRNHARGASTIEGECLLHYVDVADTFALRDARGAPAGDGAPELTIGLRTLQAGFIIVRQCRVQRISTHLPEQELFVLTPLRPVVPRPMGGNWGWSVEKMRDMCGIYEFDFSSPLNATLPPWQLEGILDNIERSFGNREVAAEEASWNSLAEWAWQSNDITGPLLRRLIPQGPARWSAWGEQCRKIIHTILQLHVMFDMKSDRNGIYPLPPV